MVLRDNLSFLRKLGAAAFPFSEEHLLSTSLAEILLTKKAPCNLERILPSALPLMSFLIGLIQKVVKEVFISEPDEKLVWLCF
ncbi:hypothetical protein BVRB_9g213690 [Beta vulgaris subsp. vulgaris]|nr:hypothetical protein BVRB_9g213690 [Beta vulgaris subsp. vulgaris]